MREISFVNIEEHRRLFWLSLKNLDRKQEIDNKEKARKRREERIKKGIW